MPVVTPQQAILIGFIVAPAIFALCAYFTRASLRRTAGGLVGAIAYSLDQYAWDRVASVAGWWSYPGYGLFSSSRLMVIGAGAAAGMADFLVYVSCMAAVLLAIRVIGGPYRADALARTPKSGILVLLVLLTGCSGAVPTTYPAPAATSSTTATATTVATATTAAPATTADSSLPPLPASATPAQPTAQGRPAVNGGDLSVTSAKPQFPNLAYAFISPAQKLDLYLPQGSGPFPLVVLVHGGGFIMGDKADANGIAGIDPLLANGYAVASPNYRLSSEAKAPAQIQDVKTAVRFLRAVAQKYNLDPAKFGAWGPSAGGNLVALLGTSCGVAALEGAELGNSHQSSCVQAVVDWFGPTDFLQIDKHFAGTSCWANHNAADSFESQLIGAPIQTRPDLVEAVNPITYVTPQAAPFLIEHGTADCDVPPRQSQLLYDALKPAIGADQVTLKSLQGATHGSSQFWEAANVKLVIDFLDRYLK